MMMLKSTDKTDFVLEQWVNQTKPDGTNVYHPA